MGVAIVFAARQPTNRGLLGGPHVDMEYLVSVGGVAGRAHTESSTKGEIQQAEAAFLPGGLQPGCTGS